MDSIGAVRRIDELGRIVIPKGIRNRLRINEGDRLQIGINDDGKIEIQKYNAFHSNYEAITNIVLTLEKEIKKAVVIISDGKVLTRSQTAPEEITNAEDVNNDIYQKLFSLKIISIDYIPLLKYGRKYSFILIPLVYNSEILGGLVIFDSKISEEDMRIVQAFRNLITMILKVWYNIFGDENEIR